MSEKTSKYPVTAKRETTSYGLVIQCIDLGGEFIHDIPAHGWVTYYLPDEDSQGKLKQSLLDFEELFQEPLLMRENPEPDPPPVMPVIWLSPHCKECFDEVNQNQELLWSETDNAEDCEKCGRGPLRYVQQEEGS